MASLLHHHGLGKDDIILVQLPNFAEQIELYLAAAKLGIIVSPIPVQYRWKEISDILDTISPSAIFTTQVKAFDHAAFYLENLGDRDIPVFVFGQSSASGARTLDGDSVSPSGDIDAAEVSADEIYTICWTSGTESAPKGVPRTHNNWMTTGHGIVHGGGMKEGCCLLNPFPNVNMASIGGLFMPWLLTGGTYVLHHPFDLGVFLSQLGGEKVNYTVMAPALLNRVLADSDLLTDIDLSHLYGLGTGSAPPDAWMIEAFKSRHGVEVTNFFGSNEGVSLTAGAADVPDPEERARFFPRAGRDDFNWNNPSLNWSRTKLVDPETGAEIDAANQAGELFIRGPSVFPGYFRRGEIHTDVFDDDGYYPSGDLFEIIEDDGGPRFLSFCRTPAGDHHQRRHEHIARRNRRGPVPPSGAQGSGLRRLSGHGSRRTGLRIRGAERRPGHRPRYGHRLPDRRRPGPVQDARAIDGHGNLAAQRPRQGRAE